MFARIARRYDLANRLLSGGMDVWWRKRLVSKVRAQSPRQLLDLATGSGDVAFALAQGVPTAELITGADFCAPMLAEAYEKKRRNPPPRAVSFQPADILALPFGDESFDVITISFGLRNLADRDRGLREMHRVLRPGGRLFILEFSQPHRWFRGIYFFYLRHVLPRVAGFITRDRAAYEYLNATISAFPDRDALAQEIGRAGFRHVTARPMTLGIVALHAARRPEQPPAALS